MSRQMQKKLVKAIAVAAIGILPSAVSSVSAQSIPPTKDVIGQNVTSVSQLSDVRPTNWAFTALQSLVERYGCIAGYPDRTFRGNQATSRDEFAAGINSCFDKINEIISAGLADKVGKEDLATLQKLQEEFAAELATLRGRVDALDAKTAKLEA
ncbi:MAG: iron uptake porin, partial [Pseudanabaena sp.]